MAVDRTRLPEAGPPLSFNFPEVRRRTLANGLRVCTIEHHEVPLVTCFVLMPIGSSQDPEHQPGLAAITGDLLDEGSGDLDALAVHEALGRIGAHLDTEIGADATLLELTTLEQYAPRALEPARFDGAEPAPGSARLRSGPRTAAQSARPAPRSAAGRRRPHLHTAALSRTPVRASADRHRGSAARAHGRRRHQPFIAGSTRRRTPP